MVQTILQEIAIPKLMKEYNFQSDSKLKKKIDDKFAQPKPVVWRRGIDISKGKLVEPRK